MKLHSPGGLNFFSIHRLKEKMDKTVMIIWKGSTKYFRSGSVNMLTIFGSKPWRSCSRNLGLGIPHSPLHCSITWPFISIESTTYWYSYFTVHKTKQTRIPMNNWWIWLSLADNSNWDHKSCSPLLNFTNKWFIFCIVGIPMICYNSFHHI